MVKRGPYFPAERTVEEMERTKQFGKEVVDLLRHQPHCRMSFNKFIPTYHHHFGRQCKLSYYGFNKLMDLFEAIPEVLMVSVCIRMCVRADVKLKFSMQSLFFYSFLLCFILIFNYLLNTFSHLQTTLN